MSVARGTSELPNSGWHTTTGWHPDAASATAGLALLPPANEGLVVTVLSPRGGAGKTTIAVNLAATLARAQPPGQASVALVDADLAFGTASRLVSTTTPYTLADVDDNVAAGALQAVTCRVLGQVDLVASPANPIAAESISNLRLSRALRVLAGTHRVTVVDTGPAMIESTLAALDATDVIVMPVIGDPHAVTSSGVAMDILQRLGINRDRVWLVANRMGAPHSLKVVDIEHALHHPVTAEVVDSPDVALAARRGRILAHDWPDHPVARAIADLGVQISPVSSRQPNQQPPSRRKFGLRHRRAA